jgi:hypothetical protein
MLAAALDVTVGQCFGETREQCPLVLGSARASGAAASLAESRMRATFLNREAGMQELLRMNDDATRERRFQFRPFAVDVSVPTEVAQLRFFNSSRGNAASTPP